MCRHPHNIVHTMDANERAHWFEAVCARMQTASGREIPATVMSDLEVLRDEHVTVERARALARLNAYKRTVCQR